VLDISILPLYVILILTPETHFFSYRLTFDISCEIVPDDYLLFFGNLIFHEESETSHEVSQKMLLPLEAVLRKREESKDNRD
jgi:hypothetical protein